MLVRLVDRVASSDGRILPVGRAKPILPPYDDSEQSKMPRQFISPYVTVFNATTIELFPGDFCRVEGDHEGDWRVEEYIGREEDDRD
jgi:hypothetical protein